MKNFTDLVCTTCGEHIPPRAAIIAGKRLEDGSVYWRWACEHVDCFEPDVVLASMGCCMAWCASHPEDKAVVFDLAAKKRNTCH